MRLRHAVTLACLVALPAAALRAQSGSAQMTATVMTAITISGSDLQFGTVLRTQTKTVAPAAGGRFVITLAPNTAVTIDYTLPSTLGPNVTLASWGALYNTISNAM